MDDIYTENGNSAFDRFKKFIDSVVEKIKSFFKKVKDAISDFFTHKNINDKLNDLEKDIKENPELGKVKVKVPDYTKLEQLNDQAISDLNHRVESTEKIMEKYRKQRNGIIAAGIATTTLTFLAAVAMAKHVESECDARLNSKIDFVTRDIDRVNKRIDGFQSDISKLATRVDKNEESMFSNNFEIRQQIHDTRMKMYDFTDELRDQTRNLNKQRAKQTEQIQAYLKEEQKLLNAYTELMSDNSKYSVAKVKNILSDVISFGRSNGAVPE